MKKLIVLFFLVASMEGFAQNNKAAAWADSVLKTLSGDEKIAQLNSEHDGKSAKLTKEHDSKITQLTKEHGDKITQLNTQIELIKKEDAKSQESLESKKIQIQQLIHIDI